MRYLLIKNNDRDIGIAMNSLGIAITWDELQLWIQHVISVSPLEELPLYIFDLVDCDPRDVWSTQLWGSPARFGIFRNFRPSWASSVEDVAAIWGVGYSRRDPRLPVRQLGVDQNIYDPDEAVRALGRYPELRAWFCDFFRDIGKPDELTRAALLQNSGRRGFTS